MMLRPRATLATVGGLAGLGVLAALASNVVVIAPAATGSGFARLPAVAVIPLVAATLVGVSLHSSMAHFELAAARRMWLWEAGQLVGLSLVATTFLSLGLIVTGHGDAVFVQLRNLGCWIGITLTGAGVLRRSQAWALPIVLMPMVFWFGHTGASPGDAASWAVVLQPEVAWWQMVVMVGLLGVGVPLSLRRGAKVRALARDTMTS